MNHRALFHLLFLCSFVCVQSVSHAQTEASAARKVFETNNSKIYGMRGLVKLEASMQAKQVLDREIPSFGIGTVISENMLVTSYRTIRPNPTIPGLSRSQKRALTLNTEVKEIKLVDGSGEEFDAKLVLHDEDLDLAFVALDPNSDNADSWSCEPVNISQDIELSHLDNVVFLSRGNESMRFQPSVRVGQVSTIIKRPRKLYSTSTLVTGGAAFNLEGQYVGMGIRKKTGSGGEISAVLPAKYIRKLLPQAIEKANSVEPEESAEEVSDEEEEEVANAEEESEAEESDDKETEEASNNAEVEATPHAQ